MVFWVYAIRSLKRDRVYIGQTGDLERRIQEHNSGLIPSTEADRPWELIASEECETRAAARWIERSLKQSRGQRKKWLAGD
jgi:putative endonuclease